MLSSYAPKVSNFAELYYIRVEIRVTRLFGLLDEIMCDLT